jgi:hypothetical protein
MTRASRGDQIFVKPKNDIYTALAGVACATVILALIAMFVQSNTVFGDGLFITSGNVPSAGR